MKELEAKSRRDFIEWFCRHFHYAPDRPYNIKVADLLDLFYHFYKIHRKHLPELYTNDITQILEVNAYLIGDNQSMLPLTLKVEAFMERSEEYIEKFLEMDFDPRDKAKIRRVRNLNAITKTLQDADYETTPDQAKQLLQFYHLWCADTRNVFTEIPTAWKKAIVGRIQKVYEAFCKVNHYRPVAYKALKNFLISKGHSHCAGSYACGLSGQSYFNNLYIPGTGYFERKGGWHGSAELEFTMLYNQLVIKIGREYYLSDGELVIPNEQAMKIAFNKRIEMLDVPGLSNNSSAISKEGGDDIISLEEDNGYLTDYPVEALQVGNDLVESARKSKEGSHSSDSSTDSFVDNFSSADLADSQTDLDSDSEDQLEELTESEIEIEAETAEILSRLGISNDEVKKISGKTIKTK